MSEVSCRAFSYFQSAERAGKISLDGLLRGLPVTRAQLENPSNRISWELWAELCDRFARHFQGDADLAATGVYVLEGAFVDFFKRSFGLFTTPRQGYEVVVKWAGPSLYRCMRQELDGPADGPFTVKVELLPAFRECRAWFVMAEGTLAKLPGYLGLPDSLVERVRLDGRGAEWRVTPPASGSMSSYFRRVIAAFRAPGVVFGELTDAQAQLVRAFSEMRGAAQAFRNTLDAMPLLVAVHREGRLLFANAALARLLGRPQEQMVGRSLSELAGDRAWPAVKRLAEGGPEAPIYVEYEARDGVHQLEARSGLDVEFGGEQAGLMFALDVTAERAAHRRAERSEAAVATLESFLPDLLVRIGRDHVVKEVHGGTSFPETALIRQLVGVDASEVLRQIGYVAGKVISDGLAELDRVLTTGVEVTRVYAVPSADGQPREIGVRMLPLPGQQEALVQLHDDTERREVDRRLVIAERMASLGTLAAGIAHEINNPLTWVLGNLDVLEAQLRSGKGGTPPAELLNELRDGCERIRDTVGRMKDFSRVQGPERRRVALREVAERAARMVENQLKHRARLILELEAAPTVLGDETELVQVVVNLLVNAVEAMPAERTPTGAWIRVRLTVEGPEAVLEVADNGKGIAPEHAPRIFDPFFTTRSSTSGTGLGLSVVLKTVERHQGTIGFESEPSKGTRFTVRLPLAPAGEAEAASDAPARPVGPARALKVVVIDDEALVARTLTRALEHCTVEAFQDGAAGLARLRTGEAPDVVLCDLMMPGTTGIEVYEQLEKARPEVAARLVFITGGAFTPQAEEFLARHEVPLLAKPFDLSGIRRVVEQVTSGP